MPDLVIYKKLALTGGGATALDGIDGADLVGNELAFVTVSNILYHYLLNATSGAAESSPDIISPDVSPGDKRWILQGVEGADISDNDSSQTLSTTAYAKSQDAVLMREPDQGVAMTAATSGSSGITVADSAHLDHGTGAGFLSCKRKLESWTVAAILMEKHDDTTGYRLSVAVTTGYVVLELNNTTYTSTTAPGFAANTEHKLTATWSPGATNTTVAFYADGVAFGAPAVQANETTTDNAVAFYAMGTDAIRTAGTDYEDIVGNFAPTAAEVLDMYRNGIPESWKWGSQTSLVTGNDSTFAGASNWTNQNFNAYDETTGGKLTVTATAGGQYCNLPAVNAPITAGKKYRLQITTSSLTGTWFVGESTNATGSSVLISTDTTTSFEFVAISSGGLFIQNNTTGTASFDDVLLYSIGPTLALLPESWQNDKPYDMTSNNLVCSYPTTGWTLTKPPAPRFDYPAVTAKTTAVTLTIAELLTLYITGTHSVGATQAYTLPTGALCDDWPAFQTVKGFEWTLSNLSAAAVDTITVTADTGHTIVGNPIVQSAHSSTGGIYGNSARFLTVKTAADTFETRRLA